MGIYKPCHLASVYTPLSATSDIFAIAYRVQVNCDFVPPHHLDLTVTGDERPLIIDYLFPVLTSIYTLSRYFSLSRSRRRVRRKAALADTQRRDLLCSRWPMCRVIGRKNKTKQSFFDQHRVFMLSFFVLLGRLSLICESCAFPTWLMALM